ncbi:MAG: hypothetical protein WCK76_11890 [Elusimicrobiota bacterium]
MATIIHLIVSFFWLIATGFLVFLAYVVFQTEANPQALWSWMVMCGLTFVSATWLAYNCIFSHHDNHHHKQHS